MLDLEDRCALIEELFDLLESISGKTIKARMIDNWRAGHPDLAEDLDFCFEVLAGKHKLGYTYINHSTILPLNDRTYDNWSIKQFVEYLKAHISTDEDILHATAITPIEARRFIQKLVNREYRLGYSNKNNMITNLSPMLAKKYPDSHHDQMYYIQEKLDGNRCIAYYNFDKEKWQFQSRSGKPLKVDFDMSWAWKYDIFDGEIMTLDHAGSRDFNRTSGAINGKYTDKSALHYYIYDIIADDKTYEDRKQILDTYDGELSKIMTNTHILPVLDKIHVYANPEYNWLLDEWLDKITGKGGEGLILRDPAAKYQCGKRTDALLKYKKVQTMDLRIIDFNFGNGKYEDAIGSFVCETDDHSIRVNVSGMPDDIHYSDPIQWIGKIIEVAYFDISKSANNAYSSLRFPRLKRIRNDKDTTSIY